MQSFRFKTNWSYLRLLANFPSKIIHNLFLALLTHRFELNYFSIFPLNASFELFICHLNKFKSFPGKTIILWSEELCIFNYQEIISFSSLFLEILFSTKPQMDDNNKYLFSSCCFHIIILLPKYFIYSSSFFKASLVVFPLSHKCELKCAP